MTWARTIGTTIFLSLLALPFAADAQADQPTSTAAQLNFSNEGIFGCNVIAGANSAGAMAAIGGVYVPVNDAAVTLNTGILVYKECVLRPMQDRLREKAMSDLLRKQYIGIESGREGNKRYVVDVGDELDQVDDKATVAYVSQGLDNVRPEFKSRIQRALVVNYQAEKNISNEPECEYEGDINSALQSSAAPVDLQNFSKLRDTDCIPFFAYINKKDTRDAVRVQARANQMKVWDWGRGFYAVTDNAQDPFAEKILTPSSVVQESFQQILGSPVRQLESANDIGQMIGALFASVTTQALTDSRGLTGLARSVAGQPSYMDQISRESSQGVIGAAVNLALSTLVAARQVEASYLAAQNGVAANLAQKIQELRGIETACWALVVPRVESYASTNSITLDPAKIRTSTTSLAFAQQVIDTQIAPQAQAAVLNVQASQTALARIDQLIAGVTNNASIAAQRLALAQWDALITPPPKVHTATDAQNAVKHRDDMAAALASLVNDTKVAWADSTDPQIGWCNINNQTVVSAWADRWKQ